MTKIERHKKAMKRKSGTIRNFATMTGIEEKQIRHYLTGKMNRPDFIAMGKQLDINIKLMDDWPGKPQITQSEREMIRVGIFIHWGTVTQFCASNPQFTDVFVSKVVTGFKKIRSARFESLVLVIQNANQKASKQQPKVKPVS